MKKLLFMLAFCLAPVLCKAQIEYRPTENRGYGYGASYGSTPPRSQDASQTVAVTAYSLPDTYAGERGVQKIRIRVRVSSGGYSGQTMSVVEKYDTKFSLNGQWVKVSPQASVRKCMHVGASNPLEAQYMYKVSINAQEWFFDL